MKEWDEYSATANYEEPTTSASTSSTSYSSVNSSNYSNYRSYGG